jgi:endonuclease YncB( thermonuclease family)
MFSFRLFYICFSLFFGSSVVLQASDIQTFKNVRYIAADWADGDSFQVQLAPDQIITIRLYGVDCMEWHVHDRSDARRLRAQRRYFGISDYGGSAGSSIELAKKSGEAASLQVRALLEKPFTVQTAFADGRGDSRYKRVYAFVTTADGKDLAEELVRLGLARAYGVYRSTPTGLSRDEYRELLKDTELVAARNEKGIWAYTNWEGLPVERQQERKEQNEEQLAMGKGPPAGMVDINEASRDELIRLPGIGEVTALAVIESRPYQNVDDLLNVPGIGPKKLENLRTWVSVSSE